MSDLPIHTHTTRSVSVDLRPWPECSRNTQMVVKWLDTWVQSVEMKIWRNQTTLQCQGCLQDSRNACRTFGMTYDCFRAAHKQRAGWFGDVCSALHRFREECGTDRLRLDWVTSLSTGAMGLKKLRAIVRIRDVEPSTIVTVSNQLGLCRRARPAQS